MSQGYFMSLNVRLKEYAKINSSVAILAFLAGHCKIFEENFSDPEKGVLWSLIPKLKIKSNQKIPLLI